MTTRLSLRTALRLRLEDSALTPLWSETQLNDALWIGMIRLSSRLPAESSLTVPVPANLRAISVTPTLTRGQIMQVIDDLGEPVPEAWVSGQDSVLTWQWWGGMLRLSRPLSTAATWTIDYRSIRTMPGDDVSTVTIKPEEEPIVVAFAMEVVLRTRAVEEMKRNGNSRPALALANAAMAEAEYLVQNRYRRLRARQLVPA